MISSCERFTKASPKLAITCYVLYLNIAASIKLKKYTVCPNALFLINAQANKVSAMEFSAISGCYVQL